MKILFLCASLEPGRDGVGDYTRLLAGQCAAQGHGCAMVAVHDPHVTEESEAPSQNVRTLRLPSTLPWPGRIARICSLLREFAPDRVSWQLVSYGFHAKGFVPEGLQRLAGSLRGPRCHVMLHELWIGLEKGAAWRARIVGWQQRRGIVRLLRKLHPEVLHTSNSAYQEVLARHGFGSALLSLFGNMPVAAAHPGDESLMNRWLPSATGAGRSGSLVGITFGTIHPQWQPAATVEWLRATAHDLGRQPALLLVGRHGPNARGVLHAFGAAGVPAATTGELDANTVSRLLRTADFGIAPHPWALIGKSGAAAALLEHGLPVLVPRDDWQLRAGPSMLAPPADPLLARLGDLDPLRTGLWLAQRRAPQSSLPRIADAYLLSLAHGGPLHPPAPSR